MKQAKLYEMFQRGQLGNEQYAAETERLQNQYQFQVLTLDRVRRPIMVECEYCRRKRKPDVLECPGCGAG